MDTISMGEALWAMHMDHMRALAQIVENSQTRGESGILMVLYHAGRPVSPGELTDRLCLTTGRVANTLREMEKNDMIRRMPAADDKRRIEVSLTPRGECAARCKSSEVIRYHARLLSHLDEDEAQELLRLLTRLVEAIDE